MWTAIWITLVILAIVTPIFLLYRLVMKGLNLVKSIDFEPSPNKKPYELPEIRKSGVAANSNDRNMARQTRIEIQETRLDRKYSRMKMVTQRWQRYGLVDDYKL